MFLFRSENRHLHCPPGNVAQIFGASARAPWPKFHRTSVCCLVAMSYPIGSMYAIYGNIYHQYTPNVSIYTIHGSYGYGCGSKLDTKRFDQVPIHPNSAHWKNAIRTVDIVQKNIKSLNRSRWFPLWYSNMAMEVHRLCTLRMIFQLRPTWASSGVAQAAMFDHLSKLSTPNSMAVKRIWSARAKGFAWVQQPNTKTGMLLFFCNLPLMKYSCACRVITWHCMNRIWNNRYQYVSVVFTRWFCRMH